MMGPFHFKYLLINQTYKMRKQHQIAEISLRYKPKKILGTIPISTSELAYENARPFFDEDTISLMEQFVVLYLNRNNKLLGGCRLSTGGITGTIADIRIILSIAVKTASTGIILAHNHPSGNTKPSATDQALTTRVREACKILDIALLDHLIIVPEGGYLSFADEGL